ncbi:MAG TPA: hypothetical protein VI756_23725, partial [Blastocatellia bacterium]
TLVSPAVGMVSPERAEAALAAALSLQPEESHAFVSAQKPLPVSRALTRHEAELVATLIRSCGLGSDIVEDRELMLETALTRARRVTVHEDHLEAGSAGGGLDIPLLGIKLIVAGLLRSQRTDFTEGAAGVRGKESAVIETYEFRSDLCVLDVYGPSLAESFRISSDGFDYSGLVQPLAYRAELNFQAAASRLAEVVPSAKFDDDYAQIRHLLDRAWPARTHREARGLKRSGAAHNLVAQSSLVSDNRDQFERYSRLMYVLLK